MKEMEVYMRVQMEKYRNVIIGGVHQKAQLRFCSEAWTCIPTIAKYLSEAFA